MQPTLQIRSINRFLAVTIGLLIVCYLIGAYSAHVLEHRRLFGFVAMFRMESEYNVPAWFSGFLLATAGALLLAISCYTIRQVSWKKSLPWCVLGFMFF